MRVAQIAPLFESVPPKFYGGTERVVHNLCRGLTDLGIEVTVFCSGDSATYGDMVPVWPEALRLANRKITDPYAYQFRMLQEVSKRAHEFDVIHNHYDYPLFQLLRMSDTPVLTTMHFRMDLPDLPAVYENFTDAPLVSISDTQRKPLPDLNWLATIHHGQNLDDMQFHPSPGSYLAFLGRFSPEKAPHWAIDIAQRSGIPLKIAAKIEEADRKYYEAMVKPRIDGKFIQYVGEITEDEKSDFLGNALAVLFPINWPEPFGLVMIEAMACGTPVLTRPVGSAPEIVLDGVTGYVRANINELADLVAPAARLDRKAIRRHVEKSFSVEHMTQEYLNVYKQLIAARFGKGHRQASHAGLA